MSILILILSFRGVEPDEKVIAENIEKLTRKLNGYETILKKQKYIAGDVGPHLINYSVKRLMI